MLFGLVFYIGWNLETTEILSSGAARDLDTFNYVYAYPRRASLGKVHPGLSQLFPASKM